MKRLLFLLFVPFFLLSAFAQKVPSDLVFNAGNRLKNVAEADFPIISDETNEQWYFIQFTNGRGVLEDQGAGNKLMTAIAVQENNDAQLWKLVASADVNGGYQYELISKSGNKLSYNTSVDRYSTVAQDGSAAVLNIYASENTTYGVDAFEMTHDGGITNNSMNQNGGASYGRELAQYNKNDQGNPLKFIKPENMTFTQFPELSTDGNEKWYYLRFPSGGGILQDMGAGNDLMTKNFIMNDDALWKITGTWSNAILESKSGNKITITGSYFSTTNTGGECSFLLIESWNNPGYLELRRNNGYSVNCMNQHGGEGIDKNLGEYGYGVSTNRIEFIPESVFPAISTESASNETWYHIQFKNGYTVLQDRRENMMLTTYPEAGLNNQLWKVVPAGKEDDKQYFRIVGKSGRSLAFKNGGYCTSLTESEYAKFTLFYNMDTNGHAIVFQRFGGENINPYGGAGPYREVKEYGGNTDIGNQLFFVLPQDMDYNNFPVVPLLTYADGSNETWYYIRFEAGGAFLKDTDAGDDQLLKTSLAAPGDAAQMWKLTGTKQTELQLTNKATGRKISFSDERFRVSQTASNLILEKTPNTSYRGLMIREGNYANDNSNAMNQVGDPPGPDKELGKYTNDNKNNVLNFFTHEELYAGFPEISSEDASDEHWYFIGFKRREGDGKVIQAPDAAGKLLQATLDGNDKQLWKFTGTWDNYKIVNKNGGAVYLPQPQADLSEDDVNRFNISSADADVFGFINTGGNWYLEDKTAAGTNGYRHFNDYSGTEIGTFYMEGGSVLSFMSYDDYMGVDENEWYYIKSLKAGGRVLQNNGVAQSVTMEHPAPGHAGQQWQLVDAGNGFYELKSKADENQKIAYNGTKFVVSVMGAAKLKPEIVSGGYGAALRLYFEQGASTGYMRFPDNNITFTAEAGAADDDASVLLLTETKIQEDLAAYPQPSTGLQDIWYRIRANRVINGEAYLTDDASEGLVTMSLNEYNNDQLWKITGTTDDYKLISYNGREICMGNPLVMQDSPAISLKYNLLQYTHSNVSDKPAWLLGAKKPDGYYTYIHKTNTNNKFIEYGTITDAGSAYYFENATPVPNLGADKQTLTFASLDYGDSESAEQTVTITSRDLITPIIYAVQGDVAAFEIVEDAWDNTSGGTLKVRFKKSAIGIYNAVIKFESTNALDLNVALTAEQTEVANLWIGNNRAFYPSENFDAADANRWSTASNWTANRVPLDTERVVFHADAIDLHVDGGNTVEGIDNAVAADLIILPDHALTVTGSINNSGTGKIRVEAGDALGHPVTKNGSIIVPSGAVVAAEVDFKVHRPTLTETTKQNELVWQYFTVPVAGAKLGSLTGTFVRYYDAVNVSKPWQLLSDINIGLDPKAGYQIAVWSANNRTFTFGGYLNTADVDVPLAKIGTGGQYVVGNPYAAGLHVASGIEFGTGVEQTLYIYHSGSVKEWKDNGQTDLEADSESITAAPGQYLSVPVNTIGFDFRLPSMQGFVVLEDENNIPDGGSSIRFKYSGAERNATYQRSHRIDNRVFSKISLVSDDNLKDCAWLFIDDSATSGYDNGYDGRKLFSSEDRAQLYFKETSGDYQVSALPEVQDNVLMFKPESEVNEYTLIFNHKNISQVYDAIYLADKKTNTVVDITADNSRYSFVTGVSAAAESRFILTLNKDYFGTTGLWPLYVQGEKLYANNPFGEGELSIAIYDITGVLIYQTTFGGGERFDIRFTYPSGVYLLKAMQGKLEKTAKIVVR